MVSPLDIAPYLADAQVTVQTAFGMTYVESFLGLYNVLGMGKKNLALVLGIETLLIALITLAAGLFCGILFSQCLCHADKPGVAFLEPGTQG